jgi:hypothetical protein
MIEPFLKRMVLAAGKLTHGIAGVYYEGGPAKVLDSSFFEHNSAIHYRVNDLGLDQFLGRHKQVL